MGTYFHSETACIPCVCAFQKLKTIETCANINLWHEHQYTNGNQLYCNFPLHCVIVKTAAQVLPRQETLTQDNECSVDT